MAENRIRAAIEAGDFGNLPGFGRPAAICDEPYDPFGGFGGSCDMSSLPSIGELDFWDPGGH